MVLVRFRSKIKLNLRNANGKAKNYRGQLSSTAFSVYKASLQVDCLIPGGLYRVRQFFLVLVF